MEQIHYTKKDFRIEWYSGSGAGGQHRNKHQNCCRITHIESGFMEHGTAHKSRVSNQRTAFEKLAHRVVKWAMDKDKVTQAISTTVIRNYHEPRNEVHDKASGLKMPYKDVVVAGNIANMVEARHGTMAKIISASINSTPAWRL